MKSRGMIELEKLELINEHGLSNLCRKDNQTGLTISLETPFQVDMYISYKKETLTFSASLKKGRNLRFYRHWKKEKTKIAEMDMEKDEVVRVFDFFFVNPNLDFDSLYLYAGVQKATGEWEVLSFPLSQVLQYDFAKSLDSVNYPSFSVLSDRNSGISVTEQDKQIHVQMYHETHNEYTNEYEYFEEGMEYEGLVLSRNKKVIEEYVAKKNSAHDERKSVYYHDTLNHLQSQMSLFIQHLKEEENKQEITHILNQLFELGKKGE